MVASRDGRDREFVQSLERGLAVLLAFSKEHPALTLSEAARLTGLSRAAARRVLLTLEALGYVRTEGRQFRLTPRVLDIGYAYLSSLDLADLAQPEMEALSERTRESCSAAVLDGADVVYVARVPTKRLMGISLGLGSRLPAYATSLGRVLLAELSDEQLDDVLAARPPAALTAHTLTEPDALRAELGRVRRQGWALVDQELELGIRSLAAPLRSRTGCVLAALNVATHASRVSLPTLRRDVLPALLEAAQSISDKLARR